MIDAMSDVLAAMSIKAMRRVNLLSQSPGQGYSYTLRMETAGSPDLLVTTYQTRGGASQTTITVILEITLMIIAFIFQI
jgi:hypothetical protein